MVRRAMVRRRPGGQLLKPVLGVVVALMLTACAGPAAADAGYRNTVAVSAKGIFSAIGSARFVVRSELAGQLGFALTDETVSAAVSDAELAAADLASRPPPTDSALRLYRRANGPIQSAVDAMRALRTAVRGREPGAMRSALSGLDGPAQQLEEVKNAATAG